MNCPFDLTNKKQVIEFEEQDKYNPQNIVKGYINRRQLTLYGKSVIESFVESKKESIEYCAKLH